MSRSQRHTTFSRCASLRQSELIGGGGGGERNGCRKVAAREESDSATQLLGASVNSPRDQLTRPDSSLNERASGRGGKRAPSRGTNNSCCESESGKILTYGHGEKVVARRTIHLDVARAHEVLVSGQRQLPLRLALEAHQSLAVAPALPAQAQPDAGPSSLC